MNLKQELYKHRVEIPSCLDDSESVVHDYKAEQIAKAYAKEKVVKAVKDYHLKMCCLSSMKWEDLTPEFRQFKENEIEKWWEANQ